MNIPIDEDSPNEEEQYCLDQIRLLRVQYERYSKPWVDRLYRIARMRSPKIFITPEQADAMIAERGKT